MARKYGVGDEVRVWWPNSRRDGLKGVVTDVLLGTYRIKFKNGRTLWLGGERLELKRKLSERGPA